MTDLLQVRATRNFGPHRAGDEFAVGDNAEHRANIESGLYELIGEKSSAPQKPKQVAPPVPAEIPKAQAKAEREKAVEKPKAKRAPAKRKTPKAS